MARANFKLSESQSGRSSESESESDYTLTFNLKLQTREASKTVTHDSVSLGPARAGPPAAA